MNANHMVPSGDHHALNEWSVRGCIHAPNLLGDTVRVLTMPAEFLL